MPIRPHFVKGTNAINEARRMIIQILQPLADIIYLITYNIDVLQGHLKKLKRNKLNELKKTLPIINLNVIKLIQPVTVCGSCVDVDQVGEKN